MLARRLPHSLFRASRRWAFSCPCLRLRSQKGGRVLELGTGTGLAWVVHGLGERVDVEVVTIELDANLQAIASEPSWPSYVQFLVGDAAELVANLGHFSLIFADAPGGKLFKLGRTVGALSPHGVLLVDDMDLGRHTDPALEAALVVVREALLSDPRLHVAEFEIGSGIMLAVRRD